MTIRTILVPVCGDGKGEGVLDHAEALGRAFDAHLSVVHCRAKPEELLPYSTMITESMRQTILESARATAADEEAHLQGLFMDYLGSTGHCLGGGAARAGRPCLCVLA